MTLNPIPCPSDVAALVALLETHDQTLVISNPPLGQRKQWRRLLWHALNEGGLPTGTRLRYTGRDGGDLIIRLVPDTPGNTPIVKPPAPIVPVPTTTPRRLHPAVAATRAAANPDRDGWVSTRHKSDVVHIYLSKPTLPRVWRVLHTLFVEAEHRGHLIGVGQNRYRSCGIGIVIDGTSVEVAVSEKQTKVPHVWTPSETRLHERYGTPPRRVSDWHPTGALRVQAGHDEPRVLASDGTRWKIEDRVGAMLERVEIIATEQAEHARRREIQRVEQVARDEARRAQRRVEDIDAHRIQQLMVRVAAHADAERIRDYLRAAVLSRPDLTDDERQWLDWAHAYADRVDSVSEPLAFLPTLVHQELA